jgi:hypothetical protein
MRTLVPALCASAFLCRMAVAADIPSVRFDGLVAHPQSFTSADLKAMPPRQVEASFGTMHGQEHHVWTGVLLLDLIGKAGPRDDNGKNPSLRHIILVHGKDGYVVAVADGEIDPMAENKPVIIAYRRDGDAGDLPGLRLVVPGDQHGARQVHDVVEVEVR